MDLKVLMIGWELPPFNSGGLGEACLGLSKALSEKGVDITFLLPKKVKLNLDFMKVVFADIRDFEINVGSPYTTSETENFYNIKLPTPSHYNHITAALLYAKRIPDIVNKVGADLIHAHDWLTFPAALTAKKMTSKPFLAHIHSTEIDRTGGHYPNTQVYNIEKKGLLLADRVLPVSKFTQKILEENYNVDPKKIEVVYNGIAENTNDTFSPALSEFKNMGYKIVLFLGRITLMKGPEYFIRAARKVLEYEKRVIFVVVGDGDMMGSMMSEAANLSIMNNFIFTGFLRGSERDSIFRSADLYVMPSVSEPFGITPLEAVSNGTPVLISKQSGVSEVLQHALKVDFWDTDEMANKILSALHYKSLTEVLKSESKKELVNINWDKAADKCINVYQQLTR